MREKVMPPCDVATIVYLAHSRALNMAVFMCLFCLCGKAHLGLLLASQSKQESWWPLPTHSQRQGTRIQWRMELSLPCAQKCKQEPGSVGVVAATQLSCHAVPPEADTACGTTTACAMGVRAIRCRFTHRQSE